MMPAPSPDIAQSDTHHDRLERPTGGAFGRPIRSRPAVQRSSPLSYGACQLRRVQRVEDSLPDKRVSHGSGLPNLLQRLRAAPPIVLMIAASMATNLENPFWRTERGVAHPCQTRYIPLRAA